MQHSPGSSTGSPEPATSPKQPAEGSGTLHDAQSVHAERAGAGEAKDKLRRGAEEVADAIKQESGTLREDLSAAAADHAETIRREAGDAVDAQRFEAADSICAVASALQAGVDALESDGQHAIAGYWRTAADGANQFADRVRHKPLGDIWHEADGYVREQPLLGFGGAMLAGFMLARFLKSSPPNESYGVGAGVTGFGPQPGASAAGPGYRADAYVSDRDQP